MFERRAFIGILGTAASILAYGGACAQAAANYPNRPVTIIVPYPTGTGSDVIARQVGQRLSERLGQPVVVSNRAGANGVIGTTAGARAAPDGYNLTLGMDATLALNPLLYKDLSYSPSGFAGVSGLVKASFVLVANPAFPANNIEELIAEAKRNPGKIDYATFGLGNGSHIAGELLNARAGINLQAVHYKSSPITDVVGGAIPLSFQPYTLAAPFLKDGRLKALGVTSTERYPALPDVPTLAESIPGYQVTPWVALFTPKGTPPAIVERLSSDIHAVLAMPDILEFFGVISATPNPLSPAQLDQLVEQDTQGARQIVEATKMSLD